MILKGFTFQKMVVSATHQHLDSPNIFQVPKMEGSSSPICSLYGYGLWFREGKPTPQK